jgi:hypothetical protein
LDSISERLKQALTEHGATIVGYADLSELPLELRDGYPFGIVIAVALDRDAVMEIKNGPNLIYYNEYHSMIN